MEQDETLRDGKIVRGESPLNLEMPFSTLDSFITPTESFYVRTHFPIPAIDRDAWWLRGEQSQFSPAKSQRGAMAPWRSRHGGMDWRAIVALARSCRCKRKRVRGNSGRNGWRYARRSQESTG